MQFIATRGRYSIDIEQAPAPFNNRARGGYLWRVSVARPRSRLERLARALRYAVSQVVAFG